VRGFALAAVTLLAGACGQATPANPGPAGPTAPSARLGPVVVADAVHGDVLLFGGHGSDTIEGDTWTWSVEGGWRRVQARPAPPARSFAGAAADGHGGVLLFGGDPSDPDGSHRDTWRWDGSRWTELHPRTLPDDGAFRAMAQGPGGAPVLVVSETDGSVRTWTWDGANWVPAPGDAQPPWRDDEGLVLDRATNRLLLVGGLTREGVSSGDTWAWDGVAWSALQPVHAPAGGPAAAAETATGPLLYERDGTWTWTGEDWSLAQPPGSPPWQPYGGLTPIPGASPGQQLAMLLTGAAGGPLQTWHWSGFGWTE
jgi:hypothetical protein